MKMGRAILVCAAVLATAALAAHAAEKRAFTIEDLYRVTAPQAARLSPDGKAIAYRLETRDFARGKENHDLYRLDVAGGEPRRLTFTADDSESAPCWSPDGKQVAFVAKRGEHPGVFLLPADGGEARELVSLSTGIGNLLWSPDGRHIAFTSDVYPECGADDACNRRLDGWREKGPLTAHVAEELLYRHWTSWSDGKVGHVLAVEVETGKVRDLTPGDREAPVFGQEGAGFAFSPDGGELAFTRNPDLKAMLARSTNSDICVVPVDPGPGGELLPPKNVTESNPAWDGQPLYSPDGKYLAFRRQETPGYESDRFRLMLLERKTGKIRDAVPGFDDWITDFEWTKDGSAIVFKADVEGQTPLFRVPASGGEPKKLVSAGQIDGFDLSPDGRAAFGVRRTVGSPPEIWRFDLTGSTAPVRLTWHNRALEEEVDIRPAETEWVDGALGAKIHVFVVKPHGFDPARKYPVILNVHGGPQMQWSDGFRGDWQVYPGAGYVVVFPNPHGSTGYGQEFTARISGDYTGAVMEDVAKVTDWIAEQPWADPERIGAMGWSWGGYAMNWLLGTTTRYRAIASMMGVVDVSTFYGATEELWFPEWDMKGTPWTSDLYETQNPARNATSFKTPTLVITGELDFRIPYTQSLQLFTYLRRQDVPAKLVVFPKAGHWPGWYEMALYYTAHLEWFHRYLGGGAPPWSTEEFAANRVFDFETGKRRTEEAEKK